jgi:NAD(P)-dependent dehydrogenase (short-subunit alcohol dehydrogenase family)
MESRARRHAWALSSSVNPMSEAQIAGFEPIRGYEVEPSGLHGRVVAITGAGQGIGRAVALGAAALGAEVVLIGRSVRRLEEVHAQIALLQRAEACIAPLDLEKAIARDYDQLTEALQRRYGRLDGLVHNAGMLGTPAPIGHYDVPTWCRVLQVNLTAAFALTQVLLPLLCGAPDASIVFTGSGSAPQADAYSGAYTVAKFGIDALMRILAQEFESSGNPRVNALNPGPVRSRLRQQAFPAEDMSGLATPEQVVPPYLWLLSPASRGVSGRSLDCQAREPAA